MCGPVGKLHLVGLSAAIVACGGGDEGFNPAPIAGTVVPAAEYNGHWTLTAQDTAGCRQGAGFTVTFDINVSDADSSTGFGSAGMSYMIPPGSLHVWHSDSLSGPLGGALARRLTSAMPQATVGVSFRLPDPAAQPGPFFQGVFDRQRTVTGLVQDLSATPMFSAQSCAYPGVAVKQ